MPIDILREGAAGGSFLPTDPEGTAGVSTSLMLALNEVAIGQFLARRGGTASFDGASRTLAAYSEAFERILGLAPGSWMPLDEACWPEC